jgi:hypothetical protein
MEWRECWGHLLEAETDPWWLSVRFLRIHNHVSSEKNSKTWFWYIWSQFSKLKKTETIGREKIIISLPILSWKSQVNWRNNHDQWFCDSDIFQRTRPSSTPILKYITSWNQWFFENPNTRRTLVMTLALIKRQVQTWNFSLLDPELLI